MSATQLLWRIIASPPAEDVESAIGLDCWICGGTMSRGLPVDDWAGASFTGQNNVALPEATHVCEACIYLMSRTSPVPGRPAKEGKKFGGNFRNYSHLIDEGVEPAYINASKGEKPAILRFLRGPKRGRWVGAIADSGQKHVITRAPVNAPGSRGVVLFDDTLVTLPGPDGWALVDDMIALLTAGATKKDVASGDYTPGAWSRCATRIQAFEERWSGARSGAWFGLALWLSQRDEIEVAERIATETAAKAEKKTRAVKPKAKKEEHGTTGTGQGATADADGRSRARAPSGVPRRARGERGTGALESSANAHEKRVEAGERAGGLGVGHLPPSADPKPVREQLPLFG